MKSNGVTLMKSNGVAEFLHTFKNMRDKPMKQSHVVYNDSVLYHQENIKPLIIRNRKISQKNAAMYCACSDIFF